MRPYVVGVHDPFAELADEAAAADAARERSRARSLRQQAAEEATLAGTLLDLAESGTDVALRSRSGRVHRGRITGVGDDVVAVGETWVRLAAVVAVRTAESRAAPAGRSDRGDVHRVRFAEALAALAPDRRSILVVPITGEPVRGTLVAVGVNVLTVALDAADRGRCVVALDAVSEVVLLD